MEYCNGFMINPTTQEVLLIKKNRPDFQKGKWNGIGGKLEPGETPIQAMVREFWEETGLQTLEGYWVHTITLSGMDSKQQPFAVHFFRHFINDFANWKFEQKTDEYVAITLAPDVYRFPTLENMKWILPLQFTTNLVFPLHLTWEHR